MIRLLRIEFHKLWTTRSFKVLLTLWILAFLTIPIGGKIFLNWIAAQGATMDFALTPDKLPLFDFEDIWQNLTYVYKWVTIFLSFIIIISVGNEFRYKTMRQNIIDGLSKKEFLAGKLLLIGFFSVIATILVFILGLVAGFAYSPVTESEYIWMNVEFVGAYFLHLIHFLIFCMLVTLVIRKGGLSIAIIMFYVYILEAAGAGIMGSFEVTKPFANLFPMESNWMLIRIPFTKYILQETQDFVALKDVLIALAWTGLFLLGSYRLIVKRDL